MELTKQQRHEIYKDALKRHKRLQSHQRKFLCVLFYETDFYNEYCEFSVSALIEFNLFRPIELKSCAWWDSEEYSSKEVKEHQRTILEFCIEMTK